MSLNHRQFQQLELEGMPERQYDPLGRDWSNASPEDKAAGEALRHHTPVVRFPGHILDTVAEEGLLNQHESGTSGGYFGPNRRLQVEEGMFGEPEEPGEHPVYGYLDDRSRHDHLMGAQGRSDANTGQYGDVRAVIHPARAARATMTIGDSLGIFGDVERKQDSFWSGLDDEEGAEPDYDNEPSFSDIAASLPHAYEGNLPVHRDSYSSYLETQYHGGTIKPEEIDHFDVDEHAWDDLDEAERAGVKARLEGVREASGIPWRIRTNRLTTQHPLPIDAGQADKRNPESGWAAWEQQNAVPAVEHWRRTGVPEGEISKRHRSLGYMNMGRYTKQHVTQETVARSPQFSSIYGGEDSLPGDRVQGWFKHMIRPTPATQDAARADRERLWRREP